MTTPRNLDEVRAVKNRVARIKAAGTYIEHGTAKIREALKIRDDDIRALIDAYGPSEAARLAGVSLSTVKLVSGRQ
jgi:DNA invertase Pin-like site-specific DNA recombinase